MNYLSIGNNSVPMHRDDNLDERLKYLIEKEEMLI